MNPRVVDPDDSMAEPGQHTEILILPEGRVLVHNLTPMMAVVLERLNPGAGEIGERVPNIGAGEGRGCP
jgi:hypothetical protein